MTRLPPWPRERPPGAAHRPDARAPRPLCSGDDARRTWSGRPPPGSRSRWSAEISLLTAVPQLELWELWQRTGRDDPPFWAYPWAGGQALARYLLDHPGIVAGRRVLDVASGSGLVAIAAAQAGAASVVAGDIDPHAVAAIAINAAANGVAVDRPRASTWPPTAPATPRWSWRATSSTSGSWPSWRSGSSAPRPPPAPTSSSPTPAAPSCPADSLTALARYQVPVLTAIEDAPVKSVTVYRLS